MLKHDYADVNGVRLHYVSKGQGKLILFVHGFPEFWYEWQNQLEEFGKDHQAVAVDMRGYNLSSKPADPEQYKMKILTEDIRQLVEHLGHQKFILVAHDWGGSVAYAFAMRHPDYLEKLIVINTFHPGTFNRELQENPKQKEASQYILMFRNPEAERILSENNYAYLRENIFGDLIRQGYFTEEDLKAYLEAWSQPGALTGGLNYYRASRMDALEGKTQPPIDESRIMVHVPTLVIWGEQDKAMVASNLDGLDKFVPDLTIKRIPDGSHWVIHEKPELVNKHIREFI